MLKHYFYLHAPLSIFLRYIWMNMNAHIMKWNKNGVVSHVNMVIKEVNCQRVIQSLPPLLSTNKCSFFHNKLLLTGIHCAIMSFHSMKFVTLNDFTFSLCVENHNGDFFIWKTLNGFVKERRKFVGNLLLCRVWNSIETYFIYKFSSGKMNFPCGKKFVCWINIRNVWGDQVNSLKLNMKLRS